MKKSNNKGFSLVELIIVIAIMAILAGAIAPALIRYIDKSRKSNDVSAAKTIKTAVETAMSNEVTYANLTDASFTSSGTTSPCLTLTPGGTASTDVAFNGTWAAQTGETTLAEAQDEIFKNLSENIPKIKYKKAADGTLVPTTWYVICSKTGQVTIVLGGATAPTSNGTSVTNGYELVPNINKYYQ